VDHLGRVADLPGTRRNLQKINLNCNLFEKKYTIKIRKLSALADQDASLGLFCPILMFLRYKKLVNFRTGIFAI
jgi:hypothetical protein